jgi:hypothetical protein
MPINISWDFLWPKNVLYSEMTNFCGLKTLVH